MGSASGHSASQPQQAYYDHQRQSYCRSERGLVTQCDLCSRWILQMILILENKHIQKKWCKDDLPIFLLMEGNTYLQGPLQISNDLSVLLLRLLQDLSMVANRYMNRNTEVTRRYHITLSTINPF